MPPPAASEYDESLPYWLRHATLPGHKAHWERAWKTLEDRENARGNARSESCGHYPSLVTTLPPSTKLNKYYSVGKSFEEEKPYAANIDEFNIHCLPYDRTATYSPLLYAKSMYLNANWVRELHGGNWWIATEAPYQRTEYEFFALFMQTHRIPLSRDVRRPRTIVQLNVSPEDGEVRHYLPPCDRYRIIESSRKNEPRIKVTVLKEKEIPDMCCVQSTIRLVYYDPEPKDRELGGPVFVSHLHFIHWPDGAVPEKSEEKKSLLKFLFYVKKINEQPTPPDDSPEENEPPIVIHCQAGIGRTGTFIAMSSLLTLGIKDPPPLPGSQLGPIPAPFSYDKIVKEVDSLREQRPLMVQNELQFEFIYKLFTKVYLQRKKQTKVKAKL